MFGKVIKQVCRLSLLLICSQAAFAANRYALVVGIDDYPSSRKLDGSVRDANQVGEFFKSVQFLEVKKLTNKEATRSAILAAFAYFQNKVKSGDAFYFYFAGHGTVFPDSKSFERDELLTTTGDINPVTGKPIFPAGKYDSAICPYDHKLNTSKKRWGNIILDDELFDEFAKFAAEGSFSVLISDSCHSGTLGRTLDSRNFRFLLPEEAYNEEDLNKPSTNQSQPILFNLTTIDERTKKMRGKYIALTAAGDNQLSEEFYFDSEKGEMGIFTYYLLEILRENSEITFGDIIPELNKRVSKKSKRQTAQIEKRFLNGDLEKIKLLRPQ